MSIGKVPILALIALAFVGAFLLIIVNKGTNRFAPVPKPVAALTPFDGKLAIESVDDLRVAGRKIVLCGAAFTKPQSMRVLATAAMRRDYQGLALRCKPVGVGTPCDGNVAPNFRDAAVVQCLTSDGTDLAAKLIEAGILCGLPAQAGSAYKSCAPGS
ncbi:hypothetical protein NKH41_21820 [Mesorhizobium sp. M1169]|uniref:hypothetical protein n=1 Tax=Mesorhizobium sp. M1169 TaxID=2957066 RepID=UPI003338E4C1